MPIVRENRIFTRIFYSASETATIAFKQCDLFTNNSIFDVLARAVGEWIQVDLKTPTPVVAVVTQGLNYPGSAQYWLTTYKISYGNSTSSLQLIQNRNGGEMVSINLSLYRSIVSEVQICITMQYGVVIQFYVTI